MKYVTLYIRHKSKLSTKLSTYFDSFVFFYVNAEEFMFDEYINIEEEFQEILNEYGKEDMVYAFLFEQKISLLEARLHSSEDPEAIGRETLIATMNFYDGDWCGIIEGDLEMEVWCPVLWYDKAAGGMTATNFRELEETCHMDRWLEALYQCKPVIIPDTSVYKESYSVEYELYSRCFADAILAVPFWHNPSGTY